MAAISHTEPDTAEALKESSRQLEEAQRLAHVGHYTHDLDTGNIVMSEENYRMLGLEPAAGFAHCRGSLCIHPEDAQLVKRHYEEALRTGALSLDHRIMRPDGETRFVHTEGRVEYGETGKPVRVFGTVQDVTERRRTEQLLHAREQAFRALVDGNPDYIIRYDRSFRRLFVNSAVCKGYGLPAEDLVGQVLGSVIQDAGLKSAPADVESIRGHITDVFLTGRPSEYEVAFPTPAGRRVFRTRYSPEFDHQGNVASVLGIASDITAIKESSRQLLTLTENSPDMIARCDCHGRYLYVNGNVERLTGLPAAELIGTFIGTAMWARLGAAVPDGLLRLREAVSRSCATGLVVESEFPLVLNGVEHIFNSRVVPERDDTGEIVSVLVIGRDVSERKQIDEARRQTDEARRQLLGEVMRAREEERGALARELHDEVGQQVTAILYGIEMMSRAKNVRETRRQAQGLKKVATDTLESLRRLAHGLHPLVLDALGLPAAIAQSAKEYAEAFGIPVEVAVHAPPETRLPKAVELALYRMCLEALTNIARHSGASGASVDLRLDGEGARLVVRDDGRGFDTAVMLDGGGPSRAFGLRGIMENASLLGGSARIESGPGGGTTVTVRIPGADIHWRPM